MICASHQSGAGSAGEIILSTRLHMEHAQRETLREWRNCASAKAKTNRQRQQKQQIEPRPAGLAAAFAAPLGAFGAAQAFAPQAIAPGVDLSEFPLCRTAADGPVLTNAPRKLKLS